jgi:hypothetical protein
MIKPLRWFVPAAAISTITLAADLTVPFTVHKDSRVSLAVYDAEGRLVRSVLTGKPLAKGQHTATWDGLDRYGHPLPPGEYGWKLIATEGLRAEFITQIGQNPDPIWEKSVCNHEPPMAAAVDQTGVYRIGTFDEGAHAGVKTDLTGRYLWTTDRDKADPWCRFGAALTLVNGRLYELVHNGTIYRYEANSGQCLTSANGNGLWNLRWEGGPAKLEGKEAEKVRHYVERAGMDLSGAAEARLLLASYRQHNAVRWFNTDGQQVAESSVPEPVAVAARADGTALVISRGAVVAVWRDGHPTQTVIAAEHLQGPWRLCVSPTTGDIFVAENSALAGRAIERPKQDFESGQAQDLAAGVITPSAGASQHHQVKRFSSEGKLLGVFGRPEGRQDGPYVATDFRGVTDLEADHEGGFVITEGHQQPPRRSARFDAHGQLLREWLGAAEYGILAHPEPDNPEYVWLHANANQGGMIRCRVNYTNKTWEIVETYRDCLTRNSLWKSGHNAYRLVAREGRLHFFSVASMYPLSALMYDPAAKTMRLSNLSGKFKEGNFWNDLNDDGLVQTNEFARFPSHIGGSIQAEDFSYYSAPSPSGGSKGFVLRPERFTSGGTPVFAVDTAAQWPAWKEWGGSYPCWDLMRASDGGWYGCFSDRVSNPRESHENHGAWYYNSCSAMDRLVKWDKDWKPVWSVGRHSPDHDHETGSQAMPRHLVGPIRDCIVWADGSDEELTRATVWTSDGLYVDELLRVPLDGIPKEMYGLQQVLEFSVGHLAIEPGTGDVLYFAVGTGGGSAIYRIKGWNGWQRESGTSKLTASPSQVAKRNGTGLTAQFFNNPDCAGEPAHTRKDALVYYHWLKGMDALPSGLTSNDFSCRWTGRLEAPTTGLYRLIFETMTPWRGEGWGTPGAPRWLKLWLGGRLIMDTKNGLFTATTHGWYGAAQLRAGEQYDLRLECGYAGNAVAKLCWETSELDRRAILPDFLHAEPGAAGMIGFPSAERPERMAEFTFDEREGVLSRSRVGLDIFGRLTGNTRRVQGKSGLALGFESRGVFAPALFPIDEELCLPDSEYTLAFWFKTTAPDVRLCEGKRYSSYNNRWSDHVISLAGGKVRFQLHGDRALHAPDPLNDGRWHQVVTTVGRGGQRLYVDSKLIATGQLTKRTTTSNRLGLDLGPGNSKGEVAIDELRVYGRCIEDGEMISTASALGRDILAEEQ